MRRRRSVPLTDGVTHAHSVLEAHGWISGSCYPAENVGQWHPSRNQIYKCVKLMNLLCVIYRYETCIVIEYRDPFFSMLFLRNKKRLILQPEGNVCGNFSQLLRNVDIV